MPKRSPLMRDQNGFLTELSDAELLADRAQPADSFALFYRRHVQAVIRFAASRSLPAETAADVVSETFLAALTGRASYRPQRESARLWLLAIASRRIADSHRHKNAEVRRQERIQNETIVLTQADHDSYAALLAIPAAEALDALADLPLTQQQAIRARVLEEQDYAEIAAALGLSEPATRQHVSRGLARIRRKLKGTS